MTPADDHPLLLLQMKTGPIDELVIGRAGAKVLIALIGLVGIAMTEVAGARLAAGRLLNVLLSVLSGS